MDKFIFYFIASIILISALISVSAKNPIHSVLFLIVSVIFFIFLLVQLEAIFLAFIFLIVYVGAISVLFLFVVMMLNIKFVDLRRMILSSTTIGGILIFSSLLFIILSFYYYNDVVLLQNFNNFFYSFISANFVDLDWFFYVNKYENIKLIGSLIYTFFFIFFILCGIILLIAMLGAIALTIQKKTGRRQQNFYQIARSSYKALFFFE
jgi:NADH-quinone oxidoreductase subunit J